VPCGLQCIPTFGVGSCRQTRTECADGGYLPAGPVLVFCLQLGLRVPDCVRAERLRDIRFTEHLTGDQAEFGLIWIQPADTCPGPVKFVLQYGCCAIECEM